RELCGLRTVPGQSNGRTDSAPPHTQLGGRKAWPRVAQFIGTEKYVAARKAFYVGLVATDGRTLSTVGWRFSRSFQRRCQTATVHRRPFFGAGRRAAER